MLRATCSSTRAFRFSGFVSAVGAILHHPSPARNMKIALDLPWKSGKEKGFKSLGLRGNSPPTKRGTKLGQLQDSENPSLPKLVSGHLKFFMSRLDDPLQFRACWFPSLSLTFLTKNMGPIPLLPPKGGEKISKSCIAVLTLELFVSGHLGDPSSEDPRNPSWSERLYKAPLRQYSVLLRLE